MSLIASNPGGNALRSPLPIGGLLGGSGGLPLVGGLLGGLQGTPDHRGIRRTLRHIQTLRHIRTPKSTASLPSISLLELLG